jgi:hypothetical protein
MEEPEVAAAIQAGDPTGLAEALDRYATPLFAYCRSILPQAESADVVEDTFVVAREKLGELRDPARLGQWLQAVARNECFRRVIAAGGTPPAEPVTPVPDLTLPDGLHGRIMMVCTDDTPAGRAHRTTVTHRSGQFGHDGFPRPVTVARGRRAPRIAAAVTAVAGTAAVVAVLVVVLSGGSPPAQVTSFEPSTAAVGVVGASSPVTSAVSSLTASPARSAKPKVTLAATHSQAPASAPAATTRQPRPSTTAPRPPATSPPAPPPTKASPRPTPPVSTSTYQPPPPPPKPILIVNQTALALVSVNGKAVSGGISILGYGTIVHWSASVVTGGGHITVSPATGTLKPGTGTTITVTATATVSFTAHITLSPGDHVVTVTVTAKKVVTKTVVTKTVITKTAVTKALVTKAAVTKALVTKAAVSAAGRRRPAKGGVAPR